MEKNYEVDAILDVDLHNRVVLPFGLAFFDFPTIFLLFLIFRRPSRGVPILCEFLSGGMFFQIFVPGDIPFFCPLF